MPYKIWACKDEPFPYILIVCCDAYVFACQVGFVPTFYFGLIMVAKQPFADRVNAVANEVATRLGVDFVHADFLGSKRDSVIRIYIDKDGGVTIEDCARFSSDVEEVFDAEDLFPWAYVLEVSSPGIERELYSLADFVKFSGQLAKVKVSSEISGQKNFVGTIGAVNDGVIEFEDRTVGPVSIPHEAVVKANLKMDLGKELKGR